MIIVLDNIRSGYNAGSILRTAAFFGLREIYLCGITPGPEHKEVKKTALGAEKTLLVKRYYSTLRLIKKLRPAFAKVSAGRPEGYKILALEQHSQALSLYEFISVNLRFDSPRFSFGKADLCKSALVVGNEITGINKKILKMADLILEIPRLGQKESLNVGVAFGIAVALLLRPGKSCWRKNSFTTTF